MTSSQKSIISLLIVHTIAVLFAFGLSGNSSLFMGLPSPFVLIFGVFAIQWLMFIPAFINQTEKFFDLTGSATYISLAIFGLLIVEKVSTTQLIVASCTLVWALRLGTFLYSRINREGGDGRFDEIKPNFFRFLNVWSIQGLWVTITSAAVIVVLTSNHQTSLHPLLWVGLVIWIFGFIIEVVADHQKKSFRLKSENKGKFIVGGLWSRSRHPNYFGEIVLWLGIAVMAVPSLAGWQWLALSSPIFVFLLLNFVSGIPLLEKRADEKWGNEKAYQQYKLNTPVLIPKLRSIDTTN